VSALPDAGVMALPDGRRVDFARLRRERRQRLLEAMAALEVDVLALGRPANVAFTSGARQLWTSGTRPFSPACLVVAATGRVHLLSTWDEGVPDEIPHGDLIGLSWNPAIAAARLRAVEGLAGAARVATDGWGATTEGLMSSLFPAAEVVDGGRVLRQARAAKSPDEMACLLTAAAAAESALTALAAALRPGVSERELVGVYAGHIASLGLPCPPSEGVAWVTSGVDPIGRPRRWAADRRLEAGDLVALQPGAAYAGYEISVGRTRSVPGAPPPAGCAHAALAARAALDAVIGACRPGVTGAELLAVWDAQGGGELHEPLVWGLGLGVEAPVVGPGRLGRGAAVRAGAVLAVQAWTHHPDAGGVLEQDVVVVGPEGPAVLTRSRSGFAHA
jgi:Xaa-Pro dipeptidase